MEVVRLVAHINHVTDEDFELKEVISFINDGIAKINTECGATYPYIDETIPNEKMYQFEEYTALHENWVRMLLVPFAAARIKENDSSQFEYMDWYGQFEAGLDSFRDRFEIPSEYKDETAKTGRYEEDYSQNMMTSQRGW